MKRTNPYILVAIIWAVLTVAFEGLSILAYIKGEFFGGAFLSCCCGGFAFGTGIVFEKANDIIQWNKQIKFLEEAQDALKFFAEMKEREKNNPFKEFDNQSELPFPEVSDKENLR